MAKIGNYNQFIEQIAQKLMIQRLNELGGYKPNDAYLIQISFEDSNKQLLLEHERYKKFQSSNNWYRSDNATTNPPVKAHYHIFPNKNGDNEIYAVNTDGTFHHKKNQGFLIPNKEADELRSFGVAINPNNIIESVDNEKQLLIESMNNLLTIYIEINEAYLIQISFEDSNKQLLLEHERYKKFQNSKNWYCSDNATTNPPVKAHYHIFPNKNGGNEIYAVNTDGTFHHKVNQGFVIPKKEADELRSFGVAINSNNIIECIEKGRFLLTKSRNNLLTIYIEITE